MGERNALKFLIQEGKISIHADFSDIFLALMEFNDHYPNLEYSEAGFFQDTKCKVNLSECSENMIYPFVPSSESELMIVSIR